MSTPNPEEIWRMVLTVPHAGKSRRWRLMGIIPSNPRCKLCNMPFRGVGSMLTHFMMGGQSKKNPRYCDYCMKILLKVGGGAEVELSMLFADIRGSTTLAEQMSATAFSQLLNRFYAAATDVLIRSDSMIDKLVGDEIIGLYFPAYAGPQHARVAIEAAQRLLRATGHYDRGGPWIPIGVGVHTGTAYVGAIGGAEGSVPDFTALGDNMNITARLVSQARPGEVVISEAAYMASGLDLGTLEHRQLELKGKSEPVGVHVLRAGHA